MGACSELGLYAEARHLFMQMAHRKLEPNIKSYSIMIGVYSYNNEPAEAIALFEKMRHRYPSASQFAYHHAIRACIELQRLQYAVNLYEEMVQENIFVCDSTYALLSGVFQKSG